MKPMHTYQALRWFSVLCRGLAILMVIATVFLAGITAIDDIMTAGIVLGIGFLAFAAMYGIGSYVDMMRQTAIHIYIISQHVYQIYKRRDDVKVGRK
jgi:hypothetical protein